MDSQNVSTNDMVDEKAKRDADIDPEIVWSRTEEMVASSTLRAMAMKVKAARDERDRFGLQVVEMEAALTQIADGVWLAQNSGETIGWIARQAVSKARAALERGDGLA